MLTLLRKIRRSLIESGSARKYLLYAIGEIALVVIGILIALQINNWNENLRNDRKGQRFISDLISDLRQDSLVLENLKGGFQQVRFSKQVLIENFIKLTITPDSLITHINQLTTGKFDFVPQETTIEEIKSGSNLDLIKNIGLRRQLVGLYNSYEDLNEKLQLGQDKNQDIIDFISQRVTDIGKVSSDEANLLMKDTYLANKVRTNYTYTLFFNTSKAYEKCLAALKELQDELKI
jgi:hypothetical protein